MQKFTSSLKAAFLFMAVLLFATQLVPGCKQSDTDNKIRLMDPSKTARLADSIEAHIKPELADSLTLEPMGY